MKLYLLLWSIAVIAVVAITVLYNRSSSVFYGIADSREVAVNFESAVEIKEIKVVAGQVIREGDTIIRCERPNLDIRINEITHNLNELKAKGHLNKDEIRSLIRQYRAEQAAIENEIRSRIRDFEAQFRLNKELTSNLKSIGGKIKPGEESSTESPIQMKIAALEEELRLAIHPLQIKINRMQSSLEGSEDPIRIQIASLEKELGMLESERDGLTILSPLDGLIGSVNFKEGERASPFTDIVTLHAKSPSFAKGYIHENLYGRFSVGQKVKVASLSKRNAGITGEIVGVGSRIIEIPQRLWTRPDIVVWGREVIIRIPARNDFLLGEKVLVTPTIHLGLRDIRR